MSDPHAPMIHSPVGASRIPARRERDLLALRILGHLAYPDGVVRPGTDDEKAEARKWRMPL